MDDKEAVKKIIDDFFNNASEQELHELQELLEKQKKEKRAPGIMDVNNIAKNFSDELRERMGLTNEQITRTARDAVRTMILQYDPKIPEGQIRVLLDKWVPDRKKKKSAIPPDAMRTMISQFAAYGRGELTEEQLKYFPEGWAKKYWSNFPEDIQKLIEAYIRDRMNRSQFWVAVDKLLK